MEIVRTTIVIGDKEVDIELSANGILFIDADGEIEQRLDLVEDIVEKLRNK